MPGTVVGDWTLPPLALHIPSATRRRYRLGIGGQIGRPLTAAVTAWVSNIFGLVASALTGGV